MTVRPLQWIVINVFFSHMNRFQDRASSQEIEYQFNTGFPGHLMESLLCLNFSFADLA